MGQQHRKVVKRRRRKAYLNRKAEREKNGIILSSRTKTAEGVKAAAKKVAAKKPAAKKAATKVKKEDEVAAAPEAAVEEVAPEATEA